MHGECLSAHIEAVEPFKARFLEIVNRQNLNRDQVYICDETGLYWKLMPNKTLATSREAQAKVYKKSKDRVTLKAWCMKHQT